jgi:hypothetical protein
VGEKGEFNHKYGAKKGRKAKERGKAPLTQLCERLLKHVGWSKIGLGKGTERTVSGFLIGLVKIHPNMGMVCSPL